MTEPNSVPEWRIYERLVAALESDHATNELTVVPNAKLLGCLSGRVRQVDVLIDARVQEDVSRRIIVDAKYRKRRVDVKDVEAFEGMMRDCRAHRGILICANGYTRTAARRAQQAIAIKLLPASAIEELDLSQWERCSGRCLTTGKSPVKHGWVLYDQVFSASHVSEPSSLVGIGKCDECGDFHMWCWDCGQKHALEGDAAEVKCDCDRFWVTAVEDEGEDAFGQRLTAVLLLVVHLPSGAWNVIDRKPLN